MAFTTTTITSKAALIIARNGEMLDRVQDAARTVAKTILETAGKSDQEYAYARTLLNSQDRGSAIVTLSINIFTTCDSNGVTNWGSNFEIVWGSDPAADPYVYNSRQGLTATVEKWKGVSNPEIEAYITANFATFAGVNA